MKRIFLSIFVLALVAMPATSNAGFFDFFKFDFKSLGAQAKSSVSTEVQKESFEKGDRDSEISYIQELLSAKGYYDGKISGLFGTITEKAVMDWQAKNGLKATGELDKTTIESIAEVRDDADSDRGGATPVSIKMLLGGSYDSVTGLMSTALNDANLIPIVEPYSGLGYNFQGGGDEETTSNVFNVTGPNAIVDWVYIEFWNVPLFGASIEYSRAALLQADGDVVDVDGISPITVPNNGEYYVVVGHRNHLPVMTLNKVDNTLPIDMTTIPLFGTEAAKIVSGKQVLWPGDINRDDVILYTGLNNDRELILSAIGGVVPTNTISGQYRIEDVNMDGVIKYTGANNDRELILQSIGGLIPTNERIAQLYNVAPLMVELVSTEETVSFGGTTSDIGIFEIRIRITNASDDDIAIPNTQQFVDGIQTNGEGIEYGVTPNAGQGFIPAGVMACMTNCNTIPGGYMIQEGEDSEFILDVSVQPQADGFFRIYLNSLNWGTLVGLTFTPNKFYTIDFGPGDYFKTAALFLNAI